MAATPPTRPAHAGPRPRPTRLLAASLRALLVALTATAGVLSGAVGLLAPGPLRDRVVALALDGLDGAIAGRLDVERLDGPLGGRLLVRGVRVVTPSGALALSADRVSTRLAYLDLLRHRVTLQAADVEGLDLPLLDAAGAVPVALAFAPVDPTPSPGPSPWSVALDAASIHGGVVSWATRGPEARARQALTELTLTTAFHLEPAGLAWSQTLLTATLADRRLTLSTAGGLADGALTLDPLNATWGPHALRAHARLPDLDAGSLDVRVDDLALDLRDAFALATSPPNPSSLGQPPHAPDVLHVSGTVRGRWAAAPDSLRADLTARGGPVGVLRVAATAGSLGPSLALTMDARDVDLALLPPGLVGGPPPPPLGATSLRAHVQGAGRPGAPDASWRAEVQLAGLFGPAGALPPRLSATAALQGPAFEATVDAPGALAARANGDLRGDYATADLRVTDLDAGPTLALVDRLSGGALGPQIARAHGHLAHLDVRAHLTGLASLTGRAGAPPLQLAFAGWLSAAEAALPLPASPGTDPTITVAGIQGHVRGTWAGPGPNPDGAPEFHADMAADLEANLEIVGARTPWGGADHLELAGGLTPTAPDEARKTARCDTGAPGLAVRGDVLLRGAWVGPRGSRAREALAVRRLDLRDVNLALCPGDWRPAGSVRLAARGFRLPGGSRVGGVTGAFRASRRRGGLLGLTATVEADAAALGGVSLPHLATRFDGTLSGRGQLRGEVEAHARAPRAGAARWERVALQARLSPRGRGRLGVEGAVHAQGMRVGAGPDVTARSTTARVSLVLGGRGLGVQGSARWRVADARSWGRAHPSLEGEVALDEGGALSLTGQGGVLRQLRASAHLPTPGRPGFELALEALRLEEARAGFLVTARRLRLGGAGGVEIDGLRVERLRGDGALTVDARLPAGRGRLHLDAQATEMRPSPWWARLRGLIGLPSTPRFPADGTFSGAVHLAGTRSALAGAVDLTLGHVRVGDVTGLDGTIRATLTAPAARGRRRGARGAPTGRLTLNAQLRQEGGGAVTLDDVSVPLALSLRAPWVRLGDAFESAGRVVLDDVELEPLGVRVGRVDPDAPDEGRGGRGTGGPEVGRAQGRPLVGQVRGQILLAPSPSRQLSLEIEARGLGVGGYTGRTATVLATLEPDRTSFGLALSWPGAPRGVRRAPPGDEHAHDGQEPGASLAASEAGEAGEADAGDEERGVLEVRAAVDAGVEPVLRGDMSWAQLAEAARGAGLGGAVELHRVGLDALPWPVAVPASVARARVDGALTVQGTVEAPLLSGAVRVAGVEVGRRAWSADVQAQPERRAAGGFVNRLGVRVTGAVGEDGARTILEGSARLPHVLPAVFDDQPIVTALGTSPALRVVARLNPVPNAGWIPWALGRTRGREVLDALGLVVPGGALGGRLAVLGGAAGPTVTATAHLERRRAARAAGGGSLSAVGAASEGELVGLARSVDVSAQASAGGLTAAVALDQLDPSRPLGREPGDEPGDAPRGGSLGLTASSPVPVRALLEGDAAAALREATYAVRLRANRFALDPLARVLPSVFGEARGVLEGAVNAQATRAGWSGAGRLVARFERVTVAPLGLARRDLDVALALGPGALELEPLVLEERGRGGGRLELAARATLGEPAPWDAGEMPLTGRFVLDRFPLLARKDLAARLDGAMDIGGTLARPRLLGRVAVARAQIAPQLGEADLQPIELPQDVRFTEGGEDPGLRAAASADRVTAAALVGRLPVDLNLDVTLPRRQVRITHPFLDVRPWGKLHAVAQGGPLRLTGRVWLGDGAVTLYEQRFVLTDQSYVDFTGHPDTDPEIHVAATYDISDVDLSAIGEETTEDSKITVRLDGTAADPGAPQLSSDPPMDESQIVSVIVLGSPVAGGGSGAASTERLSQVLMGALGLTSRLERELSFVDSLSLSAGTEALHLAVGKRVGPGLWFYYALNLGAPEGENVHEGRIEYRLGKRLQLSTRFGDARKGSLDLLYRWRY